MMQYVYCMQFPTKYAKYMKIKSTCILYHLYHLLSLLQPFPTKVCHVLMTLRLVMGVQMISS